MQDYKDNLKVTFEDNGDSSEILVSGACALALVVMLPTSGGTMGGGTVTVKMRMADTETKFTFDADNLSFTGADCRIFYAPQGALLSLNLAGATSPNLTAYIRSVPALSR